MKLSTLLSLFLCLVPLRGTPVLKIEAGAVAARVSPTLYGLMTEEINHSYDGGLYGELVSNRIFRDDPKAPAHWSVVERGSGRGALALDGTQPITALLTSCLRLDVSAAADGNTVGVANDGYWGIPIRPGTHYRVSVIARTGGSDEFSASLSVALESADGSRCYAREKLKGVTVEWKKYSLELVTGAGFPAAEGRLVVYAARPGSLYLNVVSCFPPTWRDRPNGNRIDLMEKLAGLHPAFLRLPGGNYLEGDTIATRFNWKTTLHGTYDRLGHAQPWGYRSSDGLGLLEFLEWCEDLKMQPVLAVYAGYSLRRQVVPPGSRLRLFVQDALDEIEYATGGPDTRWGSERVADGHPAPFALTYVEVGNEDGYGNYDGRFAQFFDAIRAKYPALRVIATAPVTSRIPDVYDEHFYLSAAEMEAHAHHYDNRSRGGPKVLVGEWATVSGTPWKTDPARPPTPDLGAALADAAWMTGLERNSDLVVMAAYAPLLVNVNRGAWQWQTNLIGYDGLSSYGSPSYYAQAMFSLHHGDAVPRSSLEGADRFFESVTRDTRTGDIYVKAVNPGPAALRVRIEITGIKSIAAGGRQILLASAKPTDTNSISDPERIIPVESPLGALPACFERTFAPYSVTVLRLPAR